MPEGDRNAHDRLTPPPRGTGALPRVGPSLPLDDSSCAQGVPRQTPTENSLPNV